MEKLIHGIDCCKKKENYLFLVSTVNRTRSNEAKLDQRRFRIDIRENSLMVVIINPEIAHLERIWVPHGYSFLGTD